MFVEFLELLGNPCGFPFFDFQAHKAWHSLHLGSERYITTTGGATLETSREDVRIPSF